MLPRPETALPRPAAPGVAVGTRLCGLSGSRLADCRCGQEGHHGRRCREAVGRTVSQWAHLDVRPVAVDGNDNTSFRLGDDLLVRLPSHDRYVAGVNKEHRWLPRLAPQLPLPIPQPVAKGQPSGAFPRIWSIYRWLEGRPRRALPTRGPGRLRSRRRGVPRRPLPNRPCRGATGRRPQLLARRTARPVRPANSSGHRSPRRQHRCRRRNRRVGGRPQRALHRRSGMDPR